MFIILGLDASAQADRHFVRKGNKQFKKENWQEADINYRKALVKDSTSFAANYNLANNLYRQGDYDESKNYMDKASTTPGFEDHVSDYYYNAGNIAVQKKDWQGAVEAYKQSLLMNPGDIEAKENYIYAKKMLENQQGGGGGKNDQNQNQDQNQNDQNQNQDQDQNQDQSQDQNQDNQQQNNQDQNDNSQPQDGQGKISPQQAQQMLKAIQAKEKETQDKVNKEKAAAMKSRQKEKNW